MLLNFKSKTFNHAAKCSECRANPKRSSSLCPRCKDVYLLIKPTWIPQPKKVEINGNMVSSVEIPFEIIPLMILCSRPDYDIPTIYSLNRDKEGEINHIVNHRLNIEQAQKEIFSKAVSKLTELSTFYTIS